jgi:hypothetical protein
MLTEEAADQDVLVANPDGDLAAEVEQEPGILDAAGAEAEGARPHGEAGIVRGV